MKKTIEKLKSGYEISWLIDDWDCFGKHRMLRRSVNFEYKKIDDHYVIFKYRPLSMSNSVSILSIFDKNTKKKDVREKCLEFAEAYKNGKDIKGLSL